MLKAGEFERDPGKFFEWVKFRSHLSRGVTVGTMLMDEACTSCAWAPSWSAPTTPRAWWT
jgi:hypothetical protein